MEGMFIWGYEMEGLVHNKVGNRMVGMGRRQMQYIDVRYYWCSNKRDYY